jgi:hypothetical protein
MLDEFLSITLPSRIVSTYPAHFYPKASITWPWRVLKPPLDGFQEALGDGFENNVDA